MSINRIFVGVTLSTLLCACATNTRPVEDNVSSSRDTTPSVASADTQVASAPLPPVPKESVPEAPIAPRAVEPVVEPTPAPIAKVVKPAAPVEVAKIKEPVKTVPRIEKPRAMPAPVASSTPKRPVVAEVVEKTDEAGSGLNRISGKLELIAGSGQSLGADEMSQAVVYFVPDVSTSRIKPGNFHIYTHNKEFEPASMAIPLGSTISFPNQDEILHNVFSVSPRSSFDLGIYGEGKSADYTFKKSGLVLINCNVHQSMQANVLVVDTSYIVSPDSQGRFTLDNLPAGSGKLAVWHPRATVQEQSVTTSSKNTVSLRLVLTKPRITEHLNKERKAYR